MLKKKNNRSFKSWRLVVRNLPFTTTKDELENIFAAFGEIKEINLPKCKDKRFPNSTAGFCFIQYANKKSAELALNKIPNLNFKDRKLSATFALDKDSFLTKKLSNEDEKKLMQDKIKKVLANVKKPAKNIIKKAKEIKEEINVSDNDISTSYNLKVDKQESRTYKNESYNYDDNDNDNDNDDDDDDDEELDLEIDNSLTKQHFKKKCKFEKNKNDNAVSEGRVIFLRNVDFQVSKELLKEVASKFGTVVLAVLCNYPGTDQPCGTAFVHFATKSSADNFLNELLKPEGFFINDRRVYGHRAVAREEAMGFKNEKKKEPKDKRNLHLLRASLIREGTSQANEMSNQDIELRRRLMELAKNKLKNLTMFVSSTRLAVHNIPFTMNEKKLKEIFLKETNNLNAKITECRIMREKTGIDNKGCAILGRSKGFGFVEFSHHLDALNCLKNTNNNSKLFTNERRPIVEFSIENLNALRAKEIRNQKSNVNFKYSKNMININDPAALVETKKTLMKGGQKWMPKRLGKKVRHRDMKNKNNLLKKKKTN